MQLQLRLFLQQLQLTAGSVTGGAAGAGEVGGAAASSAAAAEVAAAPTAAVAEVPAPPPPPAPAAPPVTEPATPCVTGGRPTPTRILACAPGPAGRMTREAGGRDFGRRRAGTPSRPGQGVSPSSANDDATRLVQPARLTTEGPVRVSAGIRATEIRARTGARPPGRRAAPPRTFGTFPTISGPPDRR